MMVEQKNQLDMFKEARASLNATTTTSTSRSG